MQLESSLLLSLSMIAPALAADPIPVYVLAGQSNMEGKARVEVMERQLLEEATAARYAHLRDGDEWLVRDDVIIDFLDRRGPLTVGYGSPGRIGPELGFGGVMGDHHDEPVLIIKTAWGGRSLWRDLSASLPEFEGNVAVVRTDAHWDTEAQEVFDRGWKENLEEWNRLGSDRPYHYLGSPRTMLGVGEAFGEAVLELEALAKEIREEDAADAAPDL